ncbi:MAG: hypothetical protein KA072_15105 [Thermoanaerobaculaceae bacterium]|nr:hypothetical protein [Thermoanaerobaculaceae bacterium]
MLTRAVMHIPEPRRHVIRYYGAYSSVVRVRRIRQAAAASAGGVAPGSCLSSSTSTCSDRRSPRQSGLRSPPSAPHRALLPHERIYARE